MIPTPQTLNIDTYNDSKVKETKKWSWSIVFTTLLFLLCILVSIAPLQRMAPFPLLAPLPISRLFATFGEWLPINLLHSTSSTGNVEFLVLLVLAFVLYAVCALLIRYRFSVATYVRTLSIIMCGTGIAGLLFVFTPALPSHDVFIYADYGRAIVAHGANLYFVPPLHVSPHDPITRLDGWNYALAAYGPLWLAICSVFALFLGDTPVRYVFAFRLLGLVAHVVNTLLVIGILRMMGRSRRTVTLGALLYGYNPLALIESCLGSHNDALMVAFMLSGIWFALRTTRLIMLRGYLVPVLLMSCAVLIKFTSVPLLLFFGWLLVRQSLLQAKPYVSLIQRWKRAVVNVVLAGLVSGLMILLFYGPFWIGHSVSAIMKSFMSPPSSTFAENSILRVFIEWVKLHGLPRRSPLAYYVGYALSQHPIWNTINSVTLLIAMLVGAILLWRRPTVQNMILATLFTLAAILIVTPWFYAWYVLWIVGLAVVLLGSGRTNRLFVAFALAFSASAVSSYLDGYFLVSLAPGGDWLATRVGLTIVPPLLVLFGMLLFNRRSAVKELSTQDDESQREIVPSHSGRR